MISVTLNPEKEHDGACLNRRNKHKATVFSVNTVSDNSSDIFTDYQRTDQISL